MSDFETELIAFAKPIRAIAEFSSLAINSSGMYTRISLDETLALDFHLASVDGLVKTDRNERPKEKLPLLLAFA